jgi:hypothetical protein
MSATSKPYTVLKGPNGPLGPTHDVIGPGNKSFSTHGGGKDHGKHAATQKANDLNKAFAEGRKSAQPIIDQLVSACEDFALGRKEARECEGIMRAAIAVAKGGAS